MWLWQSYDIEEKLSYASIYKKLEIVSINICIKINWYEINQIVLNFHQAGFPSLELSQSKL